MKPYKKVSDAHYQKLFNTLAGCEDGLWALQQVELVKRLRREPNVHRFLVKPPRL